MNNNADDNTGNGWGHFVYMHEHAPTILPTPPNSKPNSPMIKPGQPSVDVPQLSDLCANLAQANNTHLQPHNPQNQQSAPIQILSSSAKTQTNIATTKKAPVIIHSKNSKAPVVVSLFTEAEAQNAQKQQQNAKPKAKKVIIIE